MFVDDQVKNHAIWTVIEQLRGLKGDQVFTESASDEQTFLATQRIFQFASLAEQRLLQVPAALVSLPALNQLNSALTSAKNEVTNFISNRNVGHLANAVTQIDSVGVPYLAQIPLVGLAPGGEELAKLANDFGNQTQGILKSVLGERDRLQKEVDTLLSQVGKLGTQVQTLTEAVAKQQADASNVVQVVQTTYSAKEQEIVRSIAAVMDVQEKAHAALIEKHANATKAATDIARTQQNVLLDEISEHRDHAKELVGIIGNIGVTGNYKETADKEALAADRMRNATVGFFVVAILVGAYAVISADDIKWTVTGARLLFSFLILGVTVYTAKESARHRSNADRARRIQLELASLGPFIESLDAPKQSELRARLTDQYFGKEGEAHKSVPAIDPNGIVDLLKTAISKLGK
jgi:hypothetical protein